MNALHQLGMTVEQVRRATAGVKHAYDTGPQPRYLEGDQKSVWERVRRNERVFVALALMEVPAANIAAIEGVSAECVLVRLRPRGLTHRGRPRNQAIGTSR